MAANNKLTTPSQVLQILVFAVVKIITMHLMSHQLISTSLQIMQPKFGLRHKLKITFRNHSYSNTTFDNVSLSLKPNLITEVLPVNTNDGIDIFDQNQHSNISDSDKYFVAVQINHKPMHYEDSGVGFTENYFKSLNINVSINIIPIHITL